MKKLLLLLLFIIALSFQLEATAQNKLNVFNASYIYYGASFQSTCPSSPLGYFYHDLPEFMGREIEHPTNVNGVDITLADVRGITFRDWTYQGPGTVYTCDFCDSAGNRMPSGFRTIAGTSGTSTFFTNVSWSTASNGDFTIVIF